MSSLEAPKPIIGSLTEISDEALQELRNYLEINPPSIPIANVLGFSQFVAQQVRDPSESTFDNSTYGDPNVTGPAGPSLTGLPDGQYVVLYGASCTGSTGGTQDVWVNIAINGVMPADDTDAIEFQNTLHAAGATGILVTLSGGGNNTLKMVYRVPHGDTVDVRSRWIIVLRVAAS